VRSKVFWCALGFFAGAVMTDWLASRASAWFAHDLRLRYRTEQQLRGACALERGDLDEGVRCYREAVAATAPEADTVWVREPHGWPLGFSFTAAAFDVMVPRAPDRVRRSTEAQARALLAHALAHSGRHTEARAEFAHTARLLGIQLDATRALGASEARLFAHYARRTDRPGCYLSRSVGTAGVGASSSIR
jgi:hypothetical protein